MNWGKLSFLQNIRLHICFSILLSLFSFVPSTFQVRTCVRRVPRVQVATPLKESFKGAVSRNSPKLGITKCPLIQERHKNNRLKHKRKVNITQQIQLMPRMGKTEENWNELKLGFLKTVQSITVFQVYQCCL